MSDAASDAVSENISDTSSAAGFFGWLGWGGVAWMALLAVLALWLLGAHNRLTALRAGVLSAWTPLEAVLQSRAQGLAMLLAAAGEPLAGERAALDALSSALTQVQQATDQLRRQPLAAAGVAELAKADAVLVAVNQRFQALVLHQPALQAQPEVQAQLAALAEQQPRLLFARQAFNEAGQRYNTALAQFPTRLLGPVFRFELAGQF